MAFTNSYFPNMVDNPITEGFFVQNFEIGTGVIPPPETSYRITEDGNRRITEDGNNRILE